MIKQEREIKDSKHFQVNRLAFYVQLKTMTVDNLKKYPHSERMDVIYYLAKYGEKEELKKLSKQTLCNVD